MKKVILLVIILLLNLVSASTVDFDCPNEAVMNEEFVCTLQIFDFEGIWDLKVDLTNNGETIARIYSEEKQDFQSSYYYLKEFIEVGEKEEVRLKVEEEGDFSGLLKLRQGSKTESFDFDINVDKTLEKDSLKEKEEDIKEVNDSREEVSNLKEEIIKEKIVKEQKVISLNQEYNEPIMLEEKLVYESKNSKILRYSVYGFSLFLIFLITLLIKEKSW